jgi:hypothetical protein
MGCGIIGTFQRSFGCKKRIDCSMHARAILHGATDRMKTIAQLKYTPQPEAHERGGT